MHTRLSAAASSVLRKVAEDAASSSATTATPSSSSSSSSDALTAWVAKRSGTSPTTRLVWNDVVAFHCLGPPTSYPPQRPSEDGGMARAGRTLALMQANRADPNEATYNTLVAGYARRGQHDFALSLLTRYPTGCTPGPRALAGLLTPPALPFERASEVLQRACTACPGLRPDVRVLTRLLEAAGDAGDVSAVSTLAAAHGTRLDAVFWTSAVARLSKMGLFEGAARAWDQAVAQGAFGPATASAALNACVCEARAGRLTQAEAEERLLPFAEGVHAATAAAGHLEHSVHEQLMRLYALLRRDEKARWLHAVATDALGLQATPCFSREYTNAVLCRRGGAGGGGGGGGGGGEARFLQTKQPAAADAAAAAAAASPPLPPASAAEDAARRRPSAAAARRPVRRKASWF
eukprot:Rhum_TRINITY_DN8304_c0_g2::Rhum_TRINITY_DN8304_c0_g2_i1::g.27186::m.27186